MNTLRSLLAVALVAPALVAPLGALALSGSGTAPPGFVECSIENAICTLARPGHVIFGAGTTWTAPRAFDAGSVACLRSFFGVTTLAGSVRRTCWAKLDAVPDPSVSDVSAAPVVIVTYAFALPPPSALYRVPGGWSGERFTSVAENAQVPPICARTPPARAHAVTARGITQHGPFEYTVCETDGGGVAGWWRVNPRSSTPLADALSGSQTAPP